MRTDTERKDPNRRTVEHNMDSEKDTERKDPNRRTEEQNRTWTVQLRGGKKWRETICRGKAMKRGPGPGLSECEVHVAVKRDVWFPTAPAGNC